MPKLVHHARLRRDLERWLAEARDAGLHDESIEALVTITFHSGSQADIA